jgi:hypothetical protein
MSRLPVDNTKTQKQGRFNGTYQLDPKWSWSGWGKKS